jgi:hypothetical protein
MQMSVPKAIGILDLTCDDYYRLSEHFALIRHFYQETFTREEYITYMHEYIRAGYIGLFVGDLVAPTETTLEALDNLDMYLRETTLQDDSPIVTITPLGESYLAIKAEEARGGNTPNV